MTVIMKSSREYGLIDEGSKGIVVVLLRSYGAIGHPDLRRRPNRPSGLGYIIFQTSKCQMLKENSFGLALAWYESYDGNRIYRDYIQYACPQSCFEGQHLNKSVYPVPYFPTDPPKRRLPGSWSFLNMDELQGRFGSLVKERGYWLLRLYNNGIEPVSYDTIHSGEALVYTLMTLDHIVHEPLSNEPEPLRKGELRMTQMEKT